MQFAQQISGWSGSWKQVDLPSSLFSVYECALFACVYMQCTSTCMYIVYYNISVSLWWEIMSILIRLLVMMSMRLIHWATDSTIKPQISCSQTPTNYGRYQFCRWPYNTPPYFIKTIQREFSGMTLSQMRSIILHSAPRHHCRISEYTAINRTV